MFEVVIDGEKEDVSKLFEVDYPVMFEVVQGECRINKLGEVSNAERAAVPVSPDGERGDGRASGG